MIEYLTDAISALNNAVFLKIPFFGSEIPWVVLWLAIPMLVLTAWFGFINLRAIPTAFQVLRGRYDDPEAPGHISQFSALTTALSGTVGLGNIAGVAVAIASGGPGARRRPAWRSARARRGSRSSPAARRSGDRESRRRGWSG